MTIRKGPNTGCSTTKRRRERKRINHREHRDLYRRERRGSREWFDKLTMTKHAVILSLSKGHFACLASSAVKLKVAVL